MTLSRAKEAMKALAKQATERVLEQLEEVPEDPSARAIYMREREQLLWTLPAFSSALASAQGTPEMIGQLDPRMASRLVIRFLTVYLEAIGEEGSAAAFEETWNNLLAEMGAPSWTVWGVANLSNLILTATSLELEDDIRVIQRDEPYLQRLGFSSAEVERLAFGSYFGAGEPLLLIKHLQPKTAQSFYAPETVPLVERIRSMMSAFRLCKPGDIGVSPLVVTRIGSFELMPAGVSTLGGMGFKTGLSASQYSLETSDVPRIVKLYHMVRSLESGSDSPVNRRLKIALSSFNAAYEREFYQRESRLVDSVTALESLVGMQGEGVAFRVASRVASILAGSDDERVRLFVQVKSFYATRSNVVHGNKLSQRDQALIQDDQPLRGMARSLIVGFLHLATSAGVTLQRRWWERLDEDLLHPSRREELRELMDLS